MSRRVSMSQRGDTIVEVLIAIAVISSVLAITYSIMNRNLLIMRGNQERTEAAKLAQGQVEALLSRWKSSQANRTLITQAADAGGFCMVAGTSTPQALGGDTPAADMNNDQFDNVPADYPPPCVSGLYHLGIKRLDSTNLVYQVTVRWDSLLSSRSQVALIYMLEVMD